VSEDPVDDLVGEIESARDPRRLLVVPEPVGKHAVQRGLAGVAERRVAIS
jgi:hypothetical protein